MSTALLTHPASRQHVTPPGHPEQVARIVAIEQALADPAFTALHREDAPLAEDAAILRCHPQAHIDRLEAAQPADGALAALDADTHMSAGSLEAARRAVGGNLRAVDLVLSGQARNAFVAMRPPGHHCETAQPMGFCLFGNVAIAARHALEHHGLSRVAVVDFDVHHGNGTQDLLWDEGRALFISSHQMPLYPGSGLPRERGAHGQIVNIPLRPGTDGPVFRRAWEEMAFPALAAHRPELILVSAGFDAHRADPLAHLELTETDFDWVTRRICDLADAHCGGRVVSTLEGGYDLDALAASAAAHLSALMDRGGPPR